MVTTFKGKNKLQDGTFKQAVAATTSELGGTLGSPPDFNMANCEDPGLLAAVAYLDNEQ